MTFPKGRLFECRCIVPWWCSIICFNKIVLRQSKQHAHKLTDSTNLEIERHSSMTSIHLQARLNPGHFPCNCYRTLCTNKQTTPLTARLHANTPLPQSMGHSGTHTIAEAGTIHDIEDQNDNMITIFDELSWHSASHNRLLCIIVKFCGFLGVEKYDHPSARKQDRLVRVPMALWFCNSVTSSWYKDSLKAIVCRINLKTHVDRQFCNSSNCSSASSEPIDFWLFYGSSSSL